MKTTAAALLVLASLAGVGSFAGHALGAPPRSATAVARRARLVVAQVTEDVPGEAAVIPAGLNKEMTDSYMAYAMSVIMSRALPDARDGLKPVHRRILYAMHELNLQPEGPHRKCARVVGEVLGKYHPHGDSSVYDALVRMAQDFSLRSPLVDGHGNFGSIDPDPAAAMRYTECKLAKLAAEALLDDVKEDTVDFQDNFDASETEPMVLPAKLPMLLLNGATGIAVGMATNCPPHNLGEVVDGLRALLEDRELPDADLLKLIPAPDFPTGGVIMGLDGANSMYTTGRGSVVIRAAAHTEVLPSGRSSGRNAVIVTELPYGVGKNGLLEKIAALVNEKKLEGIAEIRDESSMQGVRVVIEVKRDFEPLVVLNNLYKRTSLQHTFAANLMAVVGEGVMPELLTLRSALLHFLDFRIECLERRSRHRLRRAEARLHLVDGLLAAQGRMDEVVGAIRGAASVADARGVLESSRFGLSAEQAEAILSMQLRRLTALERGALEAEGETLRATSAHLRTLLEERPKLLALISDELAELKTKHGTPRKSRIGQARDAELTEMDLTVNERAIVIKSMRGYMKRLPLDDFDAQARGTRGKAGMTNMMDSDAVVQIMQCNAHDNLLCISESGVAYALPAYKVPSSSRTSRGVPMLQLLPIAEGERIATVLPVAEYPDDLFLVLLTRNGWIKKTPLQAFSKITARGLIAVSLEEGDALVRASLCTLDDTVIMSSSRGQAVRFETSNAQLRASGRSSRGVKSMAMRPGDTIADMFIVPAAASDEGFQQLIAVTKFGYGKRMDLSRFKSQKRGGKGVIAIKFKRDDDRLLALSPAADSEGLLLVTQKGTIVRQRLSRISAQGRATTGVSLQRLDDDDEVASVAIVPDMPEAEAEVGEGEGDEVEDDGEVEG